MLEAERLNTESFDELVEQAVQMAGMFDSGWNNMQAADPGMTLIDLLAWLKAIQHETMSVILPESQRRFLALLDIRQKKAQGAWTAAALYGARQDIPIPARSQWLAGGILFENPQPAVALSARLSAILLEGGGQTIRYLPSPTDKKRFFAPFPGLGRTASRAPDDRMTLCFTAPLPPDEAFSLYVEIYPQTERQPVGQGPFCPMAELCWQIWTDTGWTCAEVIQDSTHEFLFSGLVTLRCRGRMARTDDGYLLRCVLRRDGYDLPPLLTRIVPGAVPLHQQDTRVQCDEFAAGEPVILHSRLGLYGNRRVFLRQQDGWVETQEFFCEARTYGMCVHVTPPNQGVLVLSWAQNLNIVLGCGAGFSGQEVPFPYQGAASVAVMVGERTASGLRYHIWEQTDDFCSASPFSRCFVCDEEQGVIRFGDHRHGAAPQKGTDNILLAGLQLCRGLSSNVRAGSITRLLGYDAALHVEHFLPASGGEDAERFEETAARAQQVLRRGDRLVTEEDYRAAVCHAPGLSIENCRVFAQSANPENRCVTVVARGPGRAARAPTEAYEKNIRYALEPRRLLTTQIRVVWPQAVRLSVTGQLVTAPRFRDSEAAVRRCVEAFLENLNQSFGAVLSYGEFYCALEMLECVSRIESLTVDAVGEHVTRTGTDDIVIPPSSFYELERLDLNLIHSFL